MKKHPLATGVALEGTHAFSCCGLRQARTKIMGEWGWGAGSWRWRMGEGESGPFRSMADNSLDHHYLCFWLSPKLAVSSSDLRALCAELHTQHQGMALHGRAQA
eukprot:1161149-Pelagomonas_calceolata.AAC.6